MQEPFTKVRSADRTQMSIISSISVGVDDYHLISASNLGSKAALCNFSYLLYRTRQLAKSVNPHSLQLTIKQNGSVPPCGLIHKGSGLSIPSFSPAFNAI